MSCTEEMSVKSLRDGTSVSFLCHPLWEKSWSAISFEKGNVYCYLYSLQLSLEFNFQYLHWKIIPNREAARKSTGLEQLIYKKTDI